MVQRFLLFLSLQLSIIFGAHTALADVPSGAEVKPDKLIIGTMHTPPFAIKHIDGSWSGISIELWREIAVELQLSYQLEEHSLPELLKGVETGQLDAAVAALTVTEQRESVMDFTHPIHSTGFAIAIPPLILHTHRHVC